MKSNSKILILASSLLMLFCFTIERANAHYLVNPETSLAKEATYGGAYLQFAKKMGGEISTKEILAQKEIQVSGCAAGSRIFQFTLYITKDGKRSSYTSKSHVLSKEILKQLRSMTAGDEFEFKRIKAYLPKKEGIVDVHAKKFIVV